MVFKKTRLGALVSALEFLDVSSVRRVELVDSEFQMNGPVSLKIVSREETFEFIFDQDWDGDLEVKLQVTNNSSGEAREFEEWHHFLGFEKSSSWFGCLKDD